MGCPETGLQGRPRANAFSLAVCMAVCKAQLLLPAAGVPVRGGVLVPLLPGEVRFGDSRAQGLGRIGSMPR